jgi:ribonucleoside-diphosphate reductase beta chain
MTLLKGRTTYKPFSYPECFDFWLKQQQAHWIATEVPMNADVTDWKLNLSDHEKAVIGGTLKGFIQSEIHVNEYWSQHVASWFPHPEIAMMSVTFGAFETIHTHAYAHLNETLAIEDYDAFLAEPTAKAKIDRLISKKPKNILEDLEFAPEDLYAKRAIARSLAVFSAFTEGVSLFANFAVLLNFAQFNKMKGLGQIISWSIRDESLHSSAGCWLFRKFISENPEIWDDELKKQIYQAARDTVSIEDDFIDKIFEGGPLEGLDPKDLKIFIRARANLKLGELGLKMNWKNLDQEALKRMDWFDALSAGVEHADFFNQRVSAYSKGVVNFNDDMFGDED